MRGVAPWCAAILGALALLVASIATASAERRVALVIGNSGYKKIAALTNPRNDAAGVATSLRDLGFEVMERFDVGRDNIRQMLKDFSRMATGAEVALVYYAGHALEYRGSYYLVPIDSDADDHDALRYDMLPSAEFRDVLAKVTGVRIMIFDACRTDLSQADGAALQTPRDPSARPARGEITVYATAPLDVAEDGKGGNSPFTKALLRQLQEPKLEVRRLFRNVSREVVEQTGGRQTPEVSIELDGRFAFNQNETDLSRWAAIRHSSEPGDFQDFLQRYPASPYAPDAKFRLEMLGRAARRVEERRRQEAARLRAEQEAREAADRERARLEREAQRRLEEQAQAERERLRVVEEERRVAALRAEEKRRSEERERVCLMESAQIQALAGGRRDPLEQLRRDAKCPDSVDRIEATLAEIDRREAAEAKRAQREEDCRRENARFDELSQTGDRAKLNSLRASASCPDTARRVETALAEIATKEETERRRQKEELDRRTVEEACRAEAETIDGLTRPGARAALADLKTRMTCRDSAERIAIALAKVDQLDADEAERVRRETCTAEVAQVVALGRDRKTAELGRLRTAPRCADTIAAADAALAEIVRLEEGDRRTRAAAEARVRRDALCRTETEKLEAASGGRDRAAVSALASGAQCDDTRRMAESALASLDAEIARACEADAAAFAEVDRSDMAAVSAFAGRATCPKMKAEAEAVAARLDEEAGARRAQTAQADRLCDGDRRKIAELETQGPAGRDGLTTLQSETSCQGLKPVILAALDRTAPAAAEPTATEPRQQSLAPDLAPAPAELPVDQPGQITKAQQALTKFGCFAGPIDAARLDETRSALEDYFEVKGDASAPLAIDDALLERFGREPAKRVCPLDCADDEIERGGQCVEAPKATPRRDAPTTSTREKPRRPSREERRQARPQREERRQARPQLEERPRRQAPVVARDPAPRQSRPVVEASQTPVKPKPRSSSAIILGN